MSDKQKKEGKAIVLKPQNMNAEGLIAQAIDKNVPVETMERLMVMRRELKAEYATEQFNRAMAAFQAECPTIDKTKPVNNKDGTRRYSFAPIESIIEQVRPFLEKYGFSYSIDSQVEEKWVTAICTATHEAGASKASSFKIPVDADAFMTAPQKFASALTFAKRYAFCEVFGILTGDQDDDGQAGGEEASQENVEKLRQAIGKSTMKQAEDLGKKVQASKKYSDGQKQVISKMVVERVEEIKKANDKENAKS